jgi:hypothetical protein
VHLCLIKRVVQVAEDIMRTVAGSKVEVGPPLDLGSQVSEHLPHGGGASCPHPPHSSAIIMGATRKPCSQEADHNGTTMHARSRQFPRSHSRHPRGLDLLDMACCGNQLGLHPTNMHVLGCAGCEH